MSKIIVIEGTDCSGKETQSNLLIEKLTKENIKIEKISFPAYETPTGKIIGGPFLGKEYITEGWFPETAPKVDPKVASLYYAADRKYNLNLIKEALKANDILLLDRYVYSNMAHQGGKIKDKNERKEMFKWLEKLEFEMLELPKADLVILLYMPYEHSLKLKQNRLEKLDQNEQNEEHLRNSEQAYLELKELYNFKKIDCTQNGILKTKEEIHLEIEKTVKKLIKRI